MKENSPVIKLAENIDINLLSEIYQLTNGRKIMMVRRPYFFVHINGYSLCQACNYIDGLPIVINEIEKILIVPELENTRIIEKGIALSPGNKIVCHAAHHGRRFDHIARHVRIPISGKSSLGGIEMHVGTAYIIDNITGYEFLADADTSHLVYSFIGNDVTDKIWDLWKNT